MQTILKWNLFLKVFLKIHFNHSLWLSFIKIHVTLNFYKIANICELLFSLYIMYQILISFNERLWVTFKILRFLTEQILFSEFCVVLSFVLHYIKLFLIFLKYIFLNFVYPYQLNINNNKYEIYQNYQIISIWSCVQPCKNNPDKNNQCPTM